MNLSPKQQKHVKYYSLGLIIIGSLYAISCLTVIFFPQNTLELYTDGKPSSFPLAVIVGAGIVGLVMAALSVASGVRVKKAQTVVSLRKAILVAMIASVVSYGLSGPLSLFGIAFLTLFISGFSLRRGLKTLLAPPSN